MHKHYETSTHLAQDEMVEYHWKFGMFSSVNAHDGFVISSDAGWWTWTTGGIHNNQIFLYATVQMMTSMNT